jgi:hypothetical protein
VTPANENSDEITVKVTTTGPRTLLCHDWFFFGSIGLQHVDDFFFEGDHEITFKGLSADVK